MAKLRALVIDDCRDVADSFAFLLETLGVAARAVYDDRSGLAAIDEFKPDIIFTEVCMPDLDGYETVRRIRQCDRPRRFILVVLTGWTEKDDRWRAKVACVDAYLIKCAKYIDEIAALLRLAARSCACPMDVRNSADHAPNYSYGRKIPKDDAVSDALAIRRKALLEELRLVRDMISRTKGHPKANANRAARCGAWGRNPRPSRLARRRVKIRAPQFHYGHEPPAIVENTKVAGRGARCGAVKRPRQIIRRIRKTTKLKDGPKVHQSVAERGWQGLQMLSVQELRAASGLPASELILGVEPSTKHRVLLSSYLLNLWRGPEAVRDMIVADFCSSADLGASARAADLLAVLRHFLDDFPEASAFSSACLRQW